MSFPEQRANAIKELATDLGLDFFETIFEIVPFDIMVEIAAYGLPTRAQHWSYGKVYNRERIHGQMGLSKIYEIVLNNIPAYAFLLDTNSDVTNLLVAAHVYAHVDFFKNNIYFADTNRNMVNEAVEHAILIDEFIEKYGLEAVEHVMDIGFAVDRHVDVHKGLQRKPYPPRQVVEQVRKVKEYEDIFGDDAFMVSRAVVGGKMPPHPEKDLLWFLATYAPIEPWEQSVLEIIRKESMYFYPQFETKILNEGWASYWHAEVINHYLLTPGEMIEFGVLHSDVVNPGGRMGVNPYYLGYKILVDIEKRWDKMYADGESKITGKQKIFEIRTLENDVSFLRNYLTKELAEKLELFTYGYACDHHPHNKRLCPKCGEIAVKSRSLDDVVESLIATRFNYGVPRILIREISSDGTMYLEQERSDHRGLDMKYSQKTIDYVHQLWKRPVHMVARNEQMKEVTIRSST
ncbi:MAG: SpoVR family protein [Acidobacteria bacterium]|nr:SpoVR family protein [Acidobacteriota bacterium]MBI3656046.1 SpoVR family protein [Acidobacteriota bacterium]